ncbi:hypothetical protein [Planktothrix sp.]|uniref:hypothetical protein n=2 Tax=Planktothrix sp. TaxID=3088171 RepID=UPI0038D43DE6
MKKIDGLNVEHDLNAVGSDVLCIFMPSVRAKKIYPYYPRLSWRQKLSHIDTLYIADPFQELDEYQEAGGSWFIDPDGISVLPLIAESLKKYVDKNHYQKIIIYGSSMGGYAAIILGSLIDNSTVIAECPQMYLDKYPASKKIIMQFCTPEKQNNIPDPISALLTATNSSYLILVNAFDHHANTHILPVMNLLISQPDSFTNKIYFSFYINDNYSRCHTALSYDDAFKYLKVFFDY